MVSSYIVCCPLLARTVLKRNYVIKKQYTIDLFAYFYRLTLFIYFFLVYSLCYNVKNATVDRVGIRIYVVLNASNAQYDDADFDDIKYCITLLTAYFFFPELNLLYDSGRAAMQSYRIEGRWHYSQASYGKE